MRVIVMLAVAVALAATACTDPAEPPSSSASDSPPPASPAASVMPHAYRSDLENTVVLAMRRGTTGDELLRDIALVAGRHGLDDWTSSEESFKAIGAGMREANVAGERAESVAELVSGGDAASRRVVLEAYGG